MAVTLCVMLWAVPGHEDALVEYEDQVLGRLADHGARLLTRVRASEGGPTEVQVLEFPSERALSGFREDAQREALSVLRERAIDRTEIIRVELVEHAEKLRPHLTP
jgi:uncharacterized protein (DUF1330 family)